MLNRADFVRQRCIEDFEWYYNYLRKDCKLPLGANTARTAALLTQAGAAKHKDILGD